MDAKQMLQTLRRRSMLPIKAKPWWRKLSLHVAYLAERAPTVYHHRCILLHPRPEETRASRKHIRRMQLCPREPPPRMQQYTVHALLAMQRMLFCLLRLITRQIEAPSHPGQAPTPALLQRPKATPILLQVRGLPLRKGRRQAEANSISQRP